MCGVYLRISDKSLSQTLSEFDSKNLEQLRKRGPDGTYFLESESVFSLYGFTRLAIRALANGNQPYSNERFISVFNCEIYNTVYLEKKINTLYPKETIPEGDAQLLGLWLYLFGPQAIKEVVGMFAGYIKIGTKIYAFRDRVGEKPLYYGFFDHIFFISSNFPSSFNEFSEISDTTLISGLHSSNLSKDTFVIEPGTYIEIEENSIILNKKIRIYRYWYWPKRNLCFNGKKYGQFEQVVIESVKSQLVSDVGISILLSGGIDSGLIAALARQEIGQSLKAFTLAFKDSKYNESNLAIKTAQHLNLQHEVIEVSDEELARNVQPALDAMDIPIFDTGALSLFTIAKEVAKENKVSLTGDGGDELFRGYSIFNYVFFLNLLAKTPSKIPVKGLIYLIEKYFAKADEYLGTELKLKRALSVTTNHRINPYYGAIGPLGGTELFDLICRRVMEKSSHNLKFISKNNLENFFINEILPKIYLVKADRMSMAHGLELRAPLLDFRVIESAFSLSKLSLHLSERKANLRKMAKSYLPEEVLTQKHGFSTPFHKVIKYLDMPDWTSYKNEEELSYFIKIWIDAKSGKESASAPAWSLLVREHFFKKIIS